MRKPTATDPVEAARAIADTVLFEGYMLYPYRANDAKNRVRWQFGVLAPPAFAAADPSEREFLQTDCLLEGHDVTVSVHARFLHVQRRTVQRAMPDGFVDVDSLDVGNASYLPWDEAVLHESVATFALPGLGAASDSADLHAPACAETELLHAEGNVVGRLVRERVALDAAVSIDAVAMPGPYGVRQLRMRLENRTRWQPERHPEPARSAAARAGGRAPAHRGQRRRVRLAHRHP